MLTDFLRSHGGKSNTINTTNKKSLQKLYWHQFNSAAWAPWRSRRRSDHFAARLWTSNASQVPVGVRGSDGGSELRAAGASVAAKRRRGRSLKCREQVTCSYTRRPFSLWALIFESAGNRARNFRGEWWDGTQRGKLWAARLRNINPR